VPEAQRAGTSRCHELLIEGAIPGGLGPAAAKGPRWVAPPRMPNKSHCASWCS
jgi:hypothetical protein